MAVLHDILLHRGVHQTPSLYVFHPAEVGEKTQKGSLPFGADFIIPQPDD
jgi:hypothetical protein